MHEGDRHAALAHGGRDTLHRAQPDVAAREDPRGARLEQVGVAVELPATGGGDRGAREHVAVAIECDLGRQPGGLGVRADEDEQPPESSLVVSPVSRRCDVDRLEGDVGRGAAATSVRYSTRMFDRVASWSMR